MRRRSILIPSALLAIAAGLALAQPAVQPGTRPGGGGGGGGGQPGQPGQPGVRPGGPGGPGGGGQPGFSPEQFIDRLMQSDANGDGKLSRDETPPQLAQRFDTLDTNTDGFLDRAELSAAANAFSGGRGGGRIPVGRAMENIENALHALEDSALDASTLTADLEQAQLMQEGFLAAKFHSATMRFEGPVLEHFEGNEAEARMEFREHLIQGLDLALELEVALMDGDADTVRHTLEALEELEHHSHDEFRID